MAQIKLNKTELKIQKLTLDQLTKFLPTLILKKQQLQMEVDAVSAIIEIKTESLNKLKEEAQNWALLLTHRSLVTVDELMEIENIDSEMANIAGVDVPQFNSISFKEPRYSLFATPPWLEVARRKLIEMVTIREEIKLLCEKERLLAEELRQTSIKVNLFEKRMIPQCKDNIRKIKIFLGDQEIAAICNAKIAKDKLKRKDILAKAKMAEGAA